MKDFEARVYLTNGKGSIKANASINILGAVIVKGFKVVEGKKDLFIGWPSEKGSDDKYYDTCYALKKDIREEIEQEIMEAYYQETDNKKGRGRR